MPGFGFHVDLARTSSLELPLPSPLRSQWLYLLMRVHQPLSALLLRLCSSAASSAGWEPSIAPQHLASSWSAGNEALNPKPT